jgi:hypothetical protein
MFFVSGNKYEGKWKFDRPRSEGTMVYANGDRYEGEWSKEQCFLLTGINTKANGKKMGGMITGHSRMQMERNMRVNGE